MSGKGQEKTFVIEAAPLLPRPSTKPLDIRDRCEPANREACRNVEKGAWRQICSVVAGEKLRGAPQPVLSDLSASDEATASLRSTPSYRTVLSIFRCPTRSSGG